MDVSVSVDPVATISATSSFNQIDTLVVADHFRRDARGARRLSDVHLAPHTLSRRGVANAGRTCYSARSHVPSISCGRPSTPLPLISNSYSRPSSDGNVKVFWGGG